ncbi:RNA-binding protein 4-like isoform X3 [Stegostoma tigrinum]|uniref:RNA-binding protein 4-like isoform X3 n=1 Tax=Stegostoma tigrinum TaxID=3053191 RepID=UPI00287052B7|nr:RNA-binding protein 4-like isoform X3 [Stegostoma tigrinum]
MVKIFIGNLPRIATKEEIKELFEKYGKLTECDIIKNYGFVHMEDKEAADEAIKNLHHHKLHGLPINVEASKSKVKTSTKLHVSNVGAECTNQELRARFEEYGPVIECDIVKDYAFVHMEREEDAMEAIRGFDGTEFKGMIKYPPDESRVPPVYVQIFGLCRTRTSAGYSAKDVWCDTPPLIFFLEVLTEVK